MATKTRQEAEKINFTKQVLDALPVPEAGRVYYHDKLTKGLMLDVMKTGTKTFFLYKRIGPKPIRYKIARYPDMPPQVARQEAKKLLGEIAEGKNPQEAKQQERLESANAKSLQEVWEHYRDNHLKHDCVAKAARDNGYLFTPIPFKSKLLRDITITDARQLHRDLSKTPIMANAVLVFLRTLFYHAIDEMHYAGPNPIELKKTKHSDRRRTSGILLNVKKNRERYIRRDELPAFFKALVAERDEDFRDLILLLLFTGARRGNVQEMKWADVSLARGEWIIPKTKNGYPVTVALTPQAMEVLKHRAANRGAAEAGGDFVFPSARAKSGHIEEPKKQWWELVKRAGLTDLHMHDLRRTFGTYQRSTGASLQMIGAALGHRSVEATQIYSRIDMTPVRESVNAATRELVKVGAFDLSKLLPGVVEATTGTNGKKRKAGKGANHAA